MSLEAHYRAIKQTTDNIFDETLRDNIEKLGNANLHIGYFREFSEFLSDKDEREMFLNFCSQLEFANVILLNGFYRQSLFALRLALELAFSLVLFSTNKLEFKEWLRGEDDIKWQKLIDYENGIISKRFAKAFFVEFIENMQSYNDQARLIYRKLSEFVHGNNHTWSEIDNTIVKNNLIIDKYFKFFTEIVEIVWIIVCCRYLKSIKLNENLLSFLLEELKHIVPIREYLGGAREQ